MQSKNNKNDNQTDFISLEYEITKYEMLNEINGEYEEKLKELYELMEQKY